MKLRQYIVDAFAERVFEGNPAAVCVLEEWLPEMAMQRIAGENNLSETAFVVKEGTQYGIRWFTPVCEVGLCGHATLATSFVLHNFYGENAGHIDYVSKSGALYVAIDNGLYKLDFPAYRLQSIDPSPVMLEALGGMELIETFLTTDVVFILGDEQSVKDFKPDFNKIAQIPEGEGILITAPAGKGRGYDFVSRCFFPKEGINEDPVCGSAHCSLIPYWAARLGKRQLTARQLSARGGTLYCEDCGERVQIGGKAVLFSVAEINVQ